MTIKTWQSRFDALPELHRTYEIAFLHMEKEIAELRAENEAVHARLAAAEHSDYGELRAALAESQTPRICEWVEQDPDYASDTWISACGETWQFMDGRLKENRVHFCHGCGGKVVEVEWKETP